MPTLSSSAQEESDAGTAARPPGEHHPPRKLKPRFLPHASTADPSIPPTSIIPTSRPSPPPSSSSSSSLSIPVSLLSNAALNSAILSSLPPHYNFELHKTIHRLLLHHSRRVALQLPEGLLAYSTLLSDLLSEYASVDVIILGDVTYGACCVDDFTAKALGCDALVHYGHSCLVPIDVTGGEDGSFMTLYVFVDIQLDLAHLQLTLERNFERSAALTLASTIQFASSLQAVAPRLHRAFPHIDIPQAKPLSRGEVLGCTSPQLPSALSAADDRPVVFIADGRFHLESLMIHNPHIPHFHKYDPYSRRLTREVYDHQAMHGLRQTAIAAAAASSHWGLILGTLGRQGAPHLLHRLQRLLTSRGIRFTTFLLSEVTPAKLALLTGEGEGGGGVRCFVQVACPRLSVDWGHEFGVAVLNGYEAEVALGLTEWRAVYPMDFYADDGGEWSNYAERERRRQEGKVKREAARREREAKRQQRRSAVAYEPE